MIAAASDVANVPNTPVSEATEAWLLSEEPSGVWAASIHLYGEWIPLGYFGAREDAEETIAACLQPPKPWPKLS
jgi:hypothetical protein